MARVRLSTTVDSTLLHEARHARSGVSDAVRVDEYPLDEADEWGDLASFCRAAASS